MSTENQNASISDATAAIHAAVQGDDVTLNLICAAMPRIDRLAFTGQLAKIQKVLDDLNAVRCIHCGKKIAKVPTGLVRGGGDRDHWFHLDNHNGACSSGGTTAEPAPVGD